MSKQEKTAERRPSVTWTYQTVTWADGSTCRLPVAVLGWEEEDRRRGVMRQRQERRRP